MRDLLYVVQRPRQSGKTYDAMTALHEQFLAGRYAESIVVFPSHSYVQLWMRAWADRFPQVPLPHYVVIGNMLSLRGRFVSFAVVEDVDTLEEGVWDPRLEALFNSMSLRPGSEILCTSSYWGLNQKAHPRKPIKFTPAQREVIKRLADEVIDRRRSKKS